MNRKLLAIIMALAILIAIIPAALAVDQNADSEGKIVFTADNSDKDGVYDPDDIKNPDPEDPDPILDPEDQDVKEFLDNLSSMDLDFGEHDVDLVNNQKYDSIDPAGVFVLSHAEKWKLSVAIAGFFLTEGEAQTIKGFEMDLTPDSGHTLGTGSAIDPKPATKLAAKNNGGLGDAQDIATGTPGITGANYAAELNVLARTASEGEAKAELVWTYAIVP